MGVVPGQNQARVTDALEQALQLRVLDVLERLAAVLDEFGQALTLGRDDASVRRGAYDELVITTGCHLPFDGDGPWRVQMAHRKAWMMWAAENRERFAPGGWFFDGQPIG